jgi:hypothetical protein
MSKKKSYFHNKLRSLHPLDMEPKSPKIIIDGRKLTRIYALGGSEVIGINTIDLSIALCWLVWIDRPVVN